MKIQFTIAYTDPLDNRLFEQYAVAEVSPADGLALIAKGVAQQVPDNTRSFVSQTLIGSCVPQETPNEEKKTPPRTKGGDFEH